MSKKVTQPGFDEFGRQICDDTPVEVPLRYQGAESRDSAITRMIREELSRAAEARGFETLEESDDFELDELDEPDHFSSYELTDMQEDVPFAAAAAESEPEPSPAEPETTTPLESKDDDKKES